MIWGEAKSVFSRVCHSWPLAPKGVPRKPKLMLRFEGVGIDFLSHLAHAPHIKNDIPKMLCMCTLNFNSSSKTLAWKVFPLFVVPLHSGRIACERLMICSIINGFHVSGTFSKPLLANMENLGFGVGDLSAHLDRELNKRERP